MSKKKEVSIRDWAQFRFSVIGGLLAQPPDTGQLCRELENLAAKRYRHPIEGSWVCFGQSTIERWYYRALNAADPIEALSRKIRSDMGTRTAVSAELFEILHNQYRQYPHWSYRLHADNLTALVSMNPELGQTPSYATVLRRMKELGWKKKRLPGSKGQQRAADRLEQREVRSFEAEYVHQLWHLDFHVGRRLVDVNGRWYTPKALCVLDDRSRLCCHIQWYLDETAEALFHGLSQAFCKRGLPRSLMTDNGGAMLAGEIENGLLRLGITHETTLAFSPYQNGKQEAFWGQLEGRLLAMLSRVKPLTLAFLNRATQAWVEQEYNRSLHAEIATSPLNRLLAGPDVSRSCPDNQNLRFAFILQESRTQRQSDGTVQIKGVRFEVPSRLRHFNRLVIGYQSWDLSFAYLIDKRSGKLLCTLFPQDKIKNANQHRKTIEPITEALQEVSDSDPIPPLLRKILADYAATGLPPAYLPKEETRKEGSNE
jgi:transposase InsO family protein